MSKQKMDRTFPLKIHVISDDELAKIVASALRQDFGEMSSAIKQIAQATNAHHRAIKNWYDAKNTPSSGHLLLLARSSQSILKFILEQIGGQDLTEAFQLLSRENPTTISRSKDGIFTDIFQDKNVPTNVPIKLLNERQLWFLDRIREQNNASAIDIIDRWNVVLKTARRDIAYLKAMGKIKFVGAKKNGRYQRINDKEER